MQNQFMDYPSLVLAGNCRRMINKMFDSIEKRYDFLNHLFSLCLDYHWRRVMVKELMPLPGRVVLDLATGTGDSAHDLVREGFSVVGLDLSLNMLLKAREKIPQPNFPVLLGTGYFLPFKDGSFDGVVCAFGIRNMHRTEVALREIFRVLKRDGKAVFLEFSMPTGFIRRPYRFYLKHVIPNIAAIVSSKSAYEYLGASIEAFPSPENFCALILDAGFSSCDKRPLSMGLVHIHKALKG